MRRRRDGRRRRRRRRRCGRRRRLRRRRVVVGRRLRPRLVVRRTCHPGPPPEPLPEPPPPSRATPCERLAAGGRRMPAKYSPSPSVSSPSVPSVPSSSSSSRHPPPPCVLLRRCRLRHAIAASTRVEACVLAAALPLRRGPIPRWSPLPSGVLVLALVLARGEVQLQPPLHHEVAVANVRIEIRRRGLGWRGRRRLR